MEVNGQLHAPTTLLQGKEPQSRSGCGGEEKKIPSPPFRKSNPGRPARSLVNVLTKLSRLVKEKYSSVNFAALVIRIHDTFQY
jgi:hypothetical protein